MTLWGCLYLMEFEFEFVIYFGHGGRVLKSGLTFANPLIMRFPLRRNSSLSSAQSTTSQRLNSKFWNNISMKTSERVSSAHLLLHSVLPFYSLKNPMAAYDYISTITHWIGSPSKIAICSRSFLSSLINLRAPNFSQNWTSMKLSTASVLRMERNSKLPFTPATATLSI